MNRPQPRASIFLSKFSRLASRWWPAALVVCAHCNVKDPAPVTAAWSDRFDRASLGLDYYKTGAGYAIHNGAVSAKLGHNHPLWLRKKLPRDIRVEFDCGSNDARGDIKVELLGDGHSFDPDGGRYTASGYELIFGGWSNSKSMIARLDEHGSDSAERTRPKVVAGQRYHWKIERRGATVTWWIDDLKTPFLTYDDPRPLEGRGHEFFAFNNWETDTWFDNLVATPL